MVKENKKGKRTRSKGQSPPKYFSLILTIDDNGRHNRVQQQVRSYTGLGKETYSGRTYPIIFNISVTPPI